MKRKMFFFERLMYVDGLTPVNCLITARLEGNIAAESLRSALHKVQGKHPLLSAKRRRGRQRTLFCIQRKSTDDSGKDCGTP